MTTSLPQRAAIAPEHTWDLESIFATLDEWERTFAELDHALPALEQFRGRLGTTAAALLGWFREQERLGSSLGRVTVYARLRFDSDTTDQANAALWERAAGLQARFAAATAFARPELLALEPARLSELLTTEPALATYRHYLANLQRQREHVRAAEVEELLAQVAEPLATTYAAYGALSNADLQFTPATGVDGIAVQVAQGNLAELLQSPDRTLRKAAWESFADGFLSVKNTMAALLAGEVKANVLRARARRYPDALTAALAEPNIPPAVYQNVIDACNRHLPIWHRYWEIRRRALGLQRLEGCDIFAPLTASQPTVPYSQAVDWICAGMAPLGEEYVAAMRAGLTHQRWVDIYPNEGKRGGAYSSGSYTTHPFILMSYTDGIKSMSTLAHEIGHSMHSYLTRRSQPYVYSRYSLFVAEVASNFNQALVRAELLRTTNDRDVQIAVIEEAMGNFHRYLFLMPILAQFELQAHRRIEQGQALTADTMSELLADLFERGYGPAVAVDRLREGIIWAQFPHLYANFYVYQYASGIAAANALADGILAGEPGAAERYRQFLAAGSARYPLDALTIAGVDMTSPAPMDRAFRVLERFVDQLDQLLFTTEQND